MSTIPFYFVDLMLLEIWKPGPNGESKLVSEEDQLVYEEASPGSTHATKIIGIITKVFVEVFGI